MNFFPIFPFSYQFLLFLHNVMQNSEKFSKFCVKNGKISGASRHLLDAMKIFKDVGMTKQGRNWHVFVRGGGKIGTFGQNIYPLRSLSNASPNVYLPFSSLQINSLDRLAPRFLLTIYIFTKYKLS